MDNMLHLSGGIVANINTDNPDQVIYLDYCGTQSYSRQRFLLDAGTLKPETDPIKDNVRVELTFADVRKLYMAYAKQRLIENISDMNDEQLEEYLIEGC